MATLQRSLVKAPPRHGADAPGADTSMGSVRKSLALSAIDSYLALVLQIGSTVVLARILTPEQTGIFAVAAVFASLASNFRDFGVGEFLIQEKELDHAILRAALTVNITVSWTMGVLLFAAAPQVADFYRSPGVQDVMRVQAFNFLLIPFGAITMAWFRRELNFKPILLANLAANITSFVVVIALGLQGFGYMALAWSSLAGVMVTVATATLLRPKGFPRWPGLAGVGRVFHFGKFASGIYVFGQAGKGAPEMIIGRAQDMAAVGMFSRAYGLIEIFNRLVLRALMPVYLPYFARSVRETGTPLRGLGTAISYLTAVGWPFLLFMGVAAYPAIRLIYGLQWLQAVPLAQVLCLAGAVEIVYYPAKEALLSQGKARESNNLQMIMQSLRVLGLLAAVPFGLPGACWGLLVATVGGAVVSHIYLARLTGWSAASAWQAMRPSLWVTLASVGPFFLFTLGVPIGEHNYLPVGAAAGLLCTALWLLALRQTGHPLWGEATALAAPLAAKFRRRPPG
jgi:O-antigen/teichoic acid export membrane protein